jgi:hypothetical protein
MRGELAESRRFPQRSTVISMVLLLFASGVGLGLAWELTPSARAQNTLNCTDFPSQAAAQAELRKDPSDPNGLDGPPGPAFDGIQGVACENLPPPKDTTPVLPNDNSSTTGEPSTPSASQNQGGTSTGGEPSTPSSATAGGATAQSGRHQKSKVVPNTIPRRPLPPTGGLPAYVQVTASILIGTALLGLGLVIRRGPRG